MRSATFKLRWAFAALAVTVHLFLPVPTKAQISPLYDRGTAGLGQLLNRLNTTASVMMIGAHPDDEDSALLAYLARGENARTAYLSLTRGDGGQNIIGPELFESLGIIRTEELLQARRLDGAEQYFARAFDYGFSKTLDEAKQKWDEKVLLCDTVRAIRTFRPLVVISRFSGTSADGHGQHQFAGYISPLAIKAAGDAGQCTGSGTPWRVLKFYRGQGFSAGSTATLRMNTGRFDPLLGRTYFEVAMEGRAQHRSQGEGRIEFHGDQFSGLNLVESVPARVANETSPFDGIDTSITGIASLTDSTDPALLTRLTSIKEEVERSRAALDPYVPEKLIKNLAYGYNLTKQAIASVDNAEAKFMLDRKAAEFAAAIRNAAGVQIDALADRETVAPGEEMNTAVKVFMPEREGVVVKEITLATEGGWTITTTVAPKENTPAFNLREPATLAAFFNVRVPNNARVSQPYWLEEPRDGDLFRWPNDENQNRPFERHVAVANVRLDIAGTEVVLTEPVRFRFADPSRGEVRRDINVVPSMTLDVDQKLLIVPVSDKPQNRQLTVTITSHSSKPQAGEAGLNINADNASTESGKTFTLKTKGEKQTVTFNITIPAGTKAGTFNIYPNAMVGEARASSTMHTIAYPHIQTHRFYTRAETLVNVLDLKTASVKVGYIMGSGDDVPEAIRQMGLPVQMLEEKDLASGDLGRFDSIVVGIRASETRPDFVANNQRLLDYVKNGGNLIVQYQRPSFAQQKLLPFPATLGPRVVDENAKVTILQPRHPIFNYPNKISDADFAGWVQERNLYNLDNFDEANYLPLLETHDVGEAENRGGLVIAKVGSGTLIYNSYSFFRQLPAGVGGAYRLFANLVSLPKAPK